MEEYFHFSKDFVALIESTKQSSRSMKPEGFWFSVGDGDDGWRAWSEKNGFRVDHFEYVSTIKFKEEAKLLILSGKEEIKKFNEDYGFEFLLGHGLDYWYIDWSMVAKKYDAIIIAPYCWEMRFGSIWYHGWDCSSGCVWNADIIESFTCERFVRAEEKATEKEGDSKP
jgi:hypothetical protein